MSSDQHGLGMQKGKLNKKIIIFHLNDDDAEIV